MKIKIIVAINIVLLCCLFVIMARGAETSIPSNKVDVVSPETSISKIEVISVDYALIKERPLFHKTRSKIEQRAEKAVEIKEVRIFPVTELTLKGIVYQNGVESTAYLINTRSEQEFGLKAKDMIEGWQVTEIFRNHITLENGGQHAQLHLLHE